MDLGKIPQQTFIPKQSMGSSIIRPNQIGSSANPLTIIGVIVLIISIGLGSALFLWNRLTDQTLADLRKKIADTSESFDQPTIDLLSNEGNRIAALQTLLKKHPAPSLVLGFLERVTLGTVAFESMSYEYNGNQAAVTLKGKAQSFRDLAAQSDFLYNQTDITNVQISDLILDQSGNVSFSLQFTPGTNLTLYSASLPASVPTVSQ